MSRGCWLKERISLLDFQTWPPTHQGRDHQHAFVHWKCRTGKEKKNKRATFEKRGNLYLGPYTGTNRLKA